MRLFASLSKVEVSIHAPVRGRLAAGGGGRTKTSVSIHAPVRGRPPTCAGSCSTTCCFDPRPRERATRGRHQRRRGDWVSIHAPVRGRPDDGAAKVIRLRVSIHAPVRGRHPRINTQIRRGKIHSQREPPALNTKFAVYRLKRRGKHLIMLHIRQRDPTRINVGARGSRALWKARKVMGRPGRESAWRRHVRPVAGLRRRDGRTAGCPWRDRSR